MAVRCCIAGCSNSAFGLRSVIDFLLSINAKGGDDDLVFDGG
jgi:hypothetical protein